MNTMYLRASLALMLSHQAYELPAGLLNGGHEFNLPRPSKRQVLARKKRQGKRK